MIGNLFGPDLGIVVVVILVVLVGGSQLPKIARNIGIAGKEFRKAQQEAEDEADKARAKGATDQPASPAAAPALASAPGVDDSIKLSRAELDALLKAREEQVRNQAGGPAAG